MHVSVAPLPDPAFAYEIDCAAWELEYPDIPHPTLAEFRVDLELPEPGVDVERYVGLLDGEPAGYLAIEKPRLDNLDNLMIKIVVHPEKRRRGVGRALFQLVVERAGTLGRTHVSGETSRERPEGSAFAAAMGASVALEETRSRLDLPPADQGRLDGMLADARAKARDYRLVRWIGVPPAEIIDGVAGMLGSFLGEAPTGELAWEPLRMDADRVRTDELRRIERGRINYNTGALHGDRLVAWTSIVSSVARPAHAWQSITLVDPGHRGHRLGMLVKLENLAYVRGQQPALSAIDTFNGDVNEHMLRINRSMGFYPKSATSYWQWTI